MLGDALFWLGLLCLAIWLYLVLLHGRFWRLGPLQLPGRLEPLAQTKIAAVIPARNEADVIGRAVASFLKQRDVTLQLFVVDDNSEDGTAAAVRSVAELAGSGDSVTLIEGRPLPSGSSCSRSNAVREGTCGREYRNLVPPRCEDSLGRSCERSSESPGVRPLGRSAGQRSSATPASSVFALEGWFGWEATSLQELASTLPHTELLAG